MHHKRIMIDAGSKKIVQNYQQRATMIRNY
jgi:hypothetical protein